MSGWWWRRLTRRLRHVDTESGHAAREARARALRKYVATLADQPQVDAAAREARELRDRNHFGEALEIAFRLRGGAT